MKDVTIASQNPVELLGFFVREGIVCVVFDSRRAGERPERPGHGDLMIALRDSSVAALAGIYGGISGSLRPSVWRGPGCQQAREKNLHVRNEEQVAFE